MDTGAVIVCMSVICVHKHSVVTQTHSCFLRSIVIFSIHILILFSVICGYENQMQAMSWKNSVMLADAVCVCACVCAVIVCCNCGRWMIISDFTSKLHRHILLKTFTRKKKNKQKSKDKKEKREQSRWSKTESQGDENNVFADFVLLETTAAVTVFN